ncbi:hypothetical protein GCM10022235_26450 [Kribbella ginsengisoli]|uniref:Uncharacterized protein n=1 Tax=Kribbella ginsengisoli TaxID=363865 RepID=A0ABP6WWH0_9ACTN
MGGDVAGAVKEDLALAAGAEAGQRPVRRSPGQHAVSPAPGGVLRPQDVAVVDREGDTVVQTAYHVGPGLVAGEADLGSVTRRAHLAHSTGQLHLAEWPPLLQPGQVVAFDNIAQGLVGQ